MQIMKEIVFHLLINRTYLMSLSFCTIKLNTILLYEQNVKTYYLKL